MSIVAAVGEIVCSLHQKGKKRSKSFILSVSGKTLFFTAENAKFVFGAPKETRFAFLPIQRYIFSALILGPRSLMN